ncbi:MAG: ribosomal RNA small subunit methyltransferase A [Planctomycetota bacterium]|nr:MAG: ribosomal RNA small subunit methyltransferase A [Planctomycetota bacterium]
MLTQKEIKRILKKNQIFPKKGLGQNFLIDGQLLNFIIQTSEISEEDFVVEVGTGLGSLTELLAQRAKTVLTIEKDEKVLGIAKDRLSNYTNILFWEGDVLHSKNALAKGWMDLLPKEPVRFVSNLPYSISTPFIVLLLMSPMLWKKSLFLVQYEIGEKIIAQPNSPSYGRLSVISQLMSKPKWIRKVPPQVFYPQPKVDSALIQLERTPSSPSPRILKILDSLLRSLFGKRRKQIGKILEKEWGIPKDQLSSLSISPRNRPEDLAPSQFLELSRFIKESGFES